MPSESKLIWVAHNNFRRFEGNPIATKYSWIDLQLAHRLELRGIRKADAFVGVSDYMMKVGDKTLNPKCLKAVIRNHFDIGYLANIQPSSLRSKLGLSPDAVLIHIPSGGTKMKGERYTYEIIRRLGKNAKVSFFISGPVGNDLEYELGFLTESPRVHSPGHQAYRDNLRDIAACDLTVSPTLIENLSSSFIESLALGVPVVTFDVGGNSELVKQGTNGFLVSYLDIESLVSVSAKAIADIAVLERLKAAAKESMEDIANPERVLREYGELFSELSG